ALEAGSGLQLDAGDPRRFSVRLAGPPSLSGQTAQLLLSMPFPNQGEIHVGDDLAQALSAYLAAPVMPAYPAGRGMSAAAVAGRADAARHPRVRAARSLRSVLAGRAGPARDRVPAAASGRRGDRHPHAALGPDGPRADLRDRSDHGLAVRAERVPAADRHLSP